MRRTIFIVLIFAASVSCAQNDVPKDESANKQEKSTINYEARRDSILEEHDYGSVYYTQDTTARSYEWLNPEEIDTSIFSTLMYDMLTELEVNHKVKRSHFKNKLVNTNWCSLYWFNNDFCLYSPSDWMSSRPILITDSLFYVMNSDPELKIITNYKLIDDSKHEFKLIDYTGNESFLVINIIDNENGIAIWEYKDQNYKTTGKSFKVLTRHVKKFPMIICDCGENKCVFENKSYFDQPDFEEMIKTYGSSTHKR